MNNETYLRPAQVSKILGVCGRTLKRWDNEGKITALRSVGGHRRYLESDVQKILGENEEPSRKKIIYARVSSHSQKEDLERQVKYLEGKFRDHEIIKDIGSGLNFKRKGLNTILELAHQGKIEELVVTHRDRLCRFGFELLEKIITLGNGKIVVLHQRTTSPQGELVEDLLEIITVFSGRLYGLRSHGIKKTLQNWRDQDPQDEDLSNRRGEDETPNDV